MLIKLQEKLFKKYPSLFVDKDKPINETCMCWGIECGDGWYDILDELCNNITKLKNYHLIKFDQVKQKYGTLRVYFTVYHVPEETAFYKNILTRYFYKIYLFLMENRIKENINLLYDQTHKLVNIAEKQSSITCESCGKDGAINAMGYWIETLCIDCKTNANRVNYE